MFQKRFEFRLENFEPETTTSTVEHDGSKSRLEFVRLEVIPGCHCNFTILT